MSQIDALHVVLGASGVIGQGIVSELWSRGIASRKVGRTSRDGWVQADLTDSAAVAGAIEGASHTYLTVGISYEAAVWRRDWPRIMDNVIAGAEKHKSKLIFLDDIYMYGPPPLHKPITEEDPQEPSSEKGKVRKQIAGSLIQAHESGRVEALISRAPDFYGPGAANSSAHALLLAKMLKGQRAMWIGDPDRLHSFGHVGDIAKATVLLALDSGAFGQVWHTPTSSEPMTARKLQGMIAAQLGTRSKLTALGPTALSMLGPFMPMIREIKEMAYQYYSDYVFSSAKFERRYPGFNVTPYEVGVRQMIGSFRSPQDRPIHRFLGS